MAGLLRPGRALGTGRSLGAYRSLGAGQALVAGQADEPLSTTRSVPIMEPAAGEAR
ncbi:hypothetical protein SAMN04490356_5668 [Streptomyces melanosporofaciens]|uniref:Uncharacterized protein n=1 Tax=Streptomyces melanosporofaciens TaxID=67327 RepID=A0A1H4VPY4_STRMJ|nr:hypothetical protein SAMN04490356_5668 [Streptomyces melanosporofaciens]